MKKSLLIFAILGFVVAFFLLLPEPEVSAADAVEQNSSRMSRNFIIKNVQVYDGEQRFEQVDVVVENHKIAEITSHYENTEQWPELDASHKTLIPGFVDAHTHVYGEALTGALNFGVTTELDMFSMPDHMRINIDMRNRADNTEQADMFSSTILATAPKGHGTEYGFTIPVLTEASQVESFVEDRLSDGADYIKAVYDSEKSVRKFFPSISLEILQALVEAAHKKGVMLVVHVDNLVSAKEVISAGADGVVHSFMDQVVDEEFVQMMKANNAFMIPTLSVLASVAGMSNSDILMKDLNIVPFVSREQSQQLKAHFPNFNVPAIGFQNALNSVKLLSDAGVTILAGTDAPNPGTSHGVSLHGELLFLSQAGLSVEQILHSATGAARAYFPIGLRGTLKKGAMASMILLNGNVFEDIKYTADIEHIWKNGINYDRKTHKASEHKNIQIAPAVISDFNDSIKSTDLSGGSIMATSDQFASGESIVSLKHHKKSDDDHFIQVEGEIKKGAMFRWAGISYLPQSNQQIGVDLSKINALTFSAKSTKPSQQITVMLFQNGAYIPSSHQLQVSDQWQSYQVNMSHFSSIDLTDITNISIVVTEPLGPFDFAVDDLEFK